MSIRSKGVFETLQSLEDLFLKNRRACYSRFGDGDVFIMMGRSQKLHQFSPALQEEMVEAFQIEDPLYCKGLAVNYPKEKGMVRGIFAPFRVNEEMELFLKQRFSLNNNAVFESAVFLHYLAIFFPKTASAFLDRIVRPRRKMFVGSIEREQIERLIGKVDYYVQTPPRDSYYSIDAWWPHVAANLDKVEMVIPATGMATRVINKRIWKTGLPVQCFDIGSLVDAIERKPTRKWIRLVGHRMTRVLVDQPRRSFRHWAHYQAKEINLLFYSLIKRI